MASGSASLRMLLLAAVLAAPAASLATCSCAIVANLDSKSITAPVLHRMAD